MSYTYLALPYSHADKDVRKQRFQFANNAAAYLMARGEVVYSPISQGHAIAKHLGEVTRNDREFWMEQSRGMLRGAGRLVVLLLPGVTESEGVREEMEIANQLGIQVETLAVIANDDGETDYNYSLNIDDGCCDGDCASCDDCKLGAN